MGISNIGRICRRGRCHDAHRRAFTLTELLVVIAILAILAALLFPTLAEAREKGRQISCASTLANLGKAFLLYSDDYDGRLPNPGGRGMLGSRAHPAVSAAGNGAVWYSAGANSSTLPNGRGAIVYYMNSSRTNNGDEWACSDAKALGGLWGAMTQGSRQSYSMNDYLREGNPGQLASSQGDIAANYNPMYHTGAMLSQVGANAGLSGADIILLFEAVQRNTGAVHRNGSPYFGEEWIGRYGSNDFPQGVPEEYHHGRSNFLFCDGHVKSLAPVYTWTATTQPQVVAFNEAYAAARGGRQGVGETDAWNPHLPYVKYP